MQPPPSRLAGPGLRAVTAIAALTAAYLAFARYTPINSFLFLEHGVDEDLARAIDLAACVALVAGALGTLFGVRSIARVMGVFVGLWFAAIALTTAVLGGEPFAHLAPLAHAARFGLPFALVLWTLRWWRGAEAVLRVALAATFAVHGYEALQHHPGFLDLVFLTKLELESLFHLAELPFEERQARAILTAIGLLDLVLAGLLLLVRWRAVALYMAFWGLLTALSRVTAGGLEWWPEVGLRVSHIGGPLVLWMIWRARPLATTDTPSAASPPSDKSSPAPSQDTSLNPSGASA
ncbi:MAG: hypothetical protein P1V81_05900 [Planctomycetota bacterium]|nr:hypothetical protein [Planctomycetota bacterium]